MTGRSRSRRRLTAGWLHPKIPPAADWVTLRRISMTTMAAESKRPAAGGFFAPGLASEPISPMTRMLSLVSCPQVRPVRALYSNGSSVILIGLVNLGSKRWNRCHVQAFLSFSGNVHLRLWKCGKPFLDLAA